MIQYDESWLWSVLLQMHGSVFPRAIFFSVPGALLSVFLTQMRLAYPDFYDQIGFSEVGKSQFWSACVGIISILLGFRTNRAMARFWEGTGLLHQMRGEWFDSVSCCVTFSRAALHSDPSRREDVMNFRHTIVRLMSLCHGSALEEIAGNCANAAQTIDCFGLDNTTLQYLKDCQDLHKFNRVEVILHLIQSLITKSLDDGVLKIPPPILSRVYQTLSRGFVNLLNAKKIADTRFPFPYVQLISALLLGHFFLTPLMIASVTSEVLWSFLFAFFPLFGMYALNFIGVELENPFGDDPNDLPLEHFQLEMNKCLLMLLQEEADIIPGVSPLRCIKDFSLIMKTMRASSYEEQVKKRITHFDKYIDVTESQMVGDIRGLDDMISRLPSTVKSTSDITPVLPLKEEKAPDPVEAAAQTEPQGAVEEPGGTASEPKMFQPDSLASTFEEFNASLQELKKSAETSAKDLGRSIAAAAEFRANLPMLLASIRHDRCNPSTKQSKAHEIVEESQSSARAAATVTNHSMPGGVGDRLLVSTNTHAGSASRTTSDTAGSATVLRVEDASRIEVRLPERKPATSCADSFSTCAVVKP